jgi:hypothetical protein
MKMKNLKRDLKSKEELERDVNNFKKKLFYYQLKFKD